MINNATRGSGALESFLSRRRSELAGQYLPATLRAGRILDIGCGRQPVFLSQIDFQEKYGLDPAVDSSTIDDGLIKLIKEPFSGRALPFDDNYFQAITMLAVSEHINPEKFKLLLAEVFRVLVPGGRLFLTTPAPWSDVILKTMVRFKLVSREEIEEHVNYLSIKQLTNLCTVTGFDVSKTKVGYFELFLNQWFYADK